MIPTFSLTKVRIKNKDDEGHFCNGMHDTNFLKSAEHLAQCSIFRKHTYPWAKGVGYTTINTESPRG